MRTAGSLFHAEQNVATAAVSASRSLALFSYMTIVTGRGEAKGRRQSAASTRLDFLGARVGSAQAGTDWTGALATVGLVQQWLGNDTPSDGTIRSELR